MIGNYNKSINMTQEQFKQLIEAPAENKEIFLKKERIIMGIIRKTVLLALSYPDLAQEYLDDPPPKVVD